MNFIVPSVEYWKVDSDIDHIARCARVCYASNNTINNFKLCNNLIANKHYSMFRHAPAYYIIKEYIYLPKEAFIDAKVVKIKDVSYVSTNGQAAMEYWDEKYSKYRIPTDVAENTEVFYKHKLLRYTFCVTTGIDITRELNRKSPNNIAEQSTRYVDFNKKLGVCFKQCHWMTGLSIKKYLIMRFMAKTSELFYKISRSKYGLNLKSQDARWILPLGTVSKAVYTYTVKDWERIINMRLYDWTGVAHPDAKIVAEQIKKELEGLGYEIDNYKEKYDNLIYTINHA